MAGCTAYTGIQGAGKTYHVVYRLCKEKKAEDYYVIHNIDGLEEDLVSEKWLGKSIYELGAHDVKEAFTVKWIAPIAKAVEEKYKRPVLLIIDEAWRILRSASEIHEELMAWCRHEGVNIWLIYQSEKQVHRNYQDLIQSQWRADNPYISPPGYFTYKRLVQGEILARKKIRKVKAIYHLYKSRERDSGKQEKSSIYVYAIGLVVITVALMIYMAGWGIRGIFEGPKESQAAVKRSSAVSARMDDSKPSSLPMRSRAPESVQAPPDPFVDYTYSGCLGDTVLLQDRGGTVFDASIVYPDYRIVECATNHARVVCSAGIVTIRKKRGHVAVAGVPGEGSQPGTQATGGVIR